MRLLNLCAFDIILGSPLAAPLPPFAKPAPLAVYNAPSRDPQRAAEGAGFPYVNDALDSEAKLLGKIEHVFIVSIEKPDGTLWAARVQCYERPNEIRNMPTIPEDVQGIVVPLALAEAMRSMLIKVRHGVLVFTPMPLQKGSNAEGKEVSYAAGLLLHEDLTERAARVEVAPQGESVAHSTYL